MERNEKAMEHRKKKVKGKWGMERNGWQMEYRKSGMIRQRERSNKGKEGNV